MKKQSNKPQNAMQAFGLHYPPFSDTFDVQSPYQSEKETLIIHRSLTLLTQGRSLALYGEAGTEKSMLTKTVINELDSKCSLKNKVSDWVDNIVPFREHGMLRNIDGIHLIVSWCLFCCIKFLYQICLYPQSCFCTCSSDVFQHCFY